MVALRGATEATARARAAEEHLRSAATEKDAAGDQLQAAALAGLHADHDSLQRQLKDSQRALAKVYPLPSRAKPKSTHLLA